VTFSYSGKKGHQQRNTYTKFKRAVRRLDSAPSTKKSSKSKHKAVVAVVTIDSARDDEESTYSSAPAAKKPAPATQASSSSLVEIDLTSGGPHPEATDAAPVWDYMDPKTKQWTKFPGALPKMVEGLSKRSVVFSLQIPGLGGYQVTLDTMTMKSTNAEMDTQIRRTPPLKSTSASPVLPRDDSSSSSSSLPSTNANNKKKKGGDVEHAFEVDPELTAKCKKATNWKVISTSKDAEAFKDSKCVICYDEFTDSRPVVHLSKCGTHYFHENCIAASYKPGFVSCPVCQTIYGIRTGTQPKGTMKSSTSSEGLHGYEKYGCITINYNFNDGIQEAHHPSPGSVYYGTSRTAYLPDCPEGRKVLKLLELAFQRQLVFTIGTSVTTGQSDCVIWNGIHHKTSQTGGSTNFGYPDETYLERVTDELNAKGVTLD